MFEQRLWADGEPSWDEPLPLYDGPERSELDYLAEVDAQVGADPWTRPEPSAAEVIARGETEAVTAELIGQLSRLDPSTVDEDLRVGLTVAWARAGNYCDAHRALAAAAVTKASPDDVQIPRELHAAAQLGAALGMGRVSADLLVSASTELVDRLPAVRDAAVAGNLSWRKAATLATATLALSDEQAEQVAERVLPKAWGKAVGAFDAAVRKAVDLVDPDGIDTRKTRRRDVVRLVRHHYGDGMGQLFADLPSEDLETIWLATDRWARRRKTDGDPRSLDQLRVDALHCWAASFLTHGDPTHCDRICHPTSPHPVADLADPADPAVTTEPAPVAVASEFSLPTGHGRQVKLTVVWDLTSLLGLTRHPGLLLDADTVIAPSTVEDLITAGLRVRRGVIDVNGWLVDLTRCTWALPPTDGSHHPGPVELLLTTTARLDELPPDQQRALHDLDSTNPQLAATLRDLLDAPLTAHDLDAHPADEQPGAALAAYTCLRAGHPVNPTAGPTSATAADLDHHQAKSQGGNTERTNLGPVTRRWHRLKTFDGWTIHQTSQGWEWTGPTGRTYLIEPFDYRLGP